MPIAWPRTTICAVAALLAATVTAPAAGGKSGSIIIQSVGARVAANPAVPPLHLSEAQRAQVREALSKEDTEVDLALKAVKSAAQFEPAIGTKAPKALPAHPLPRPLIYAIPALKRYTYVKFRHQVLIVNPMTREIVDLFPEA